MEILKWCGAEKGAEYTGVTEEDNKKIRWYDNLLGDPLPGLSDWDPPTLTQYRGSNGKRALRDLCDAPSSASINLISQRAADSLRDIWDYHATLYPVSLADAPEQDFYMVVANTILNCLDRERSEGPLQKYGATPDAFASVYKWVFDEECIGKNVLFRIPDSKTTTYVTETFKQRVREAGLKGFCLKKEFWDTNEWVS